MKKIVVRAAVVLFAMVLSCGLATQASAKVKVKSVAVKSVTGSKKVVYVAKGKKVKLTTNVTVTPNSAKNRRVTYKSNKKEVATVNSMGVIKGVKIGYAKVTVQSKKNKSKKATIKVRVVYPVKKVAISNKNVALNVDDSKNLAVKVTGTKKKNFCKIVQWTTSNKKVAIVSAKGTVKAVGVGTATITAKAVDGTGKKASCRVKVAPRKTSIMGISFNSYYNSRYTGVIYVSLNQPKVLSENDFSVITKFSADSQYTREEKVTSVVTNNNKDYVITLDGNIYSGGFVQVTINSLDGVKTKEQCFVASDGYQRVSLKATVGYYFSYQLHNDFSDYSTVKIDSGRLPAGLTYDAKDNVISGIPTAVTYNQKCNISVTDDRGHVVKGELNFIVGDAEHIVVASNTLGDLKDSRILSSNNFQYSVEACGGSGSYEYHIENSCDKKFSVDITSGNFLANSGTLEPGTYYPSVRVIDKANDKIFTVATWTIIVTKGVLVSADFTTSNYQYTTVYFRNKETGNESNIFVTNGIKSLNVEPGTYDVYYFSTRSDGERRCNYLSSNLSITKDTILKYNISNIFDVTCNLQDEDGNAYNGKDITACMFNSLGKCVGTYDCASSTACFSRYETGNYYIYFYDKNTKQLIGKIDTFALEGKLELTVKLSKKNPI